MHHNAPLRLLADIGGTHVRFALQHRGGLPCELRRYAVADYASLTDAALAYFSEVRPATLPTQGCMGIATAVTGNWVQMTNHSWGFSVAQLQAQLGLEALRVINDFTALALSLTALQSADWVQLGGHLVSGNAANKLPLALLGAGTGLGVSGVVFGAQGQPIPLAGEGGHTSLPAATADEFALVQWLTERYGHASAERVLSGQGLLDTYRFYCQQQGTEPQLESPQAVAQTALGSVSAASSDLLAAKRALDTFCALLGSVAGNLALTLGARGGVFVGGGMVPKLLELGGGYFAQSPFRTRFEAKGRFADYLRGIPVYLIKDGSAAALLGAGVALDQSETPSGTHAATVG